MEREELQRAAQRLIDDSPLSAYVDQPRREVWVSQLRVLLQDLVSSAEQWGLLPPIESDNPPPGVRLLGNSLGFIDPEALYRVIPWQSADGDLGVRVTRSLFSNFKHVTVADRRRADDEGTRIQRWWQFATDNDLVVVAEDRILGAGQLDSQHRFIHELARRTGWPVSETPAVG